MQFTRFLPLLAAGLVACFPSLPPEDEDTAVSDALADAGLDAAPDTDEADTGPDASPDVDEDTQPQDVPPDTTPDVAPDATPDVAPDADPDGTGEDTDAGPTLNACGGEGEIIGDPVGSDCGPCSDGELVCDTADPEKRRTVCDGASALNACGGCGVIEPPLEAACDECGVITCEAGGTGRAVCVEPSGGCETFLTCNDLNCVDQSRACVEGSDTADAACGACLEGFVDVGGACLRATITPADVTATRDLADRVTITWTASPFATGYRVYRCEKETTCSESDWSLVPNGEVATTRYDDLGTESAPEPSAPSVSATTNAVAHVDVTWQAVPDPTARSYRYRVAALAPAGETAPSAAVVGSRLTREVTGYELQIGGGAWQAIGDVLTFRDEGAPAPTLSGGTATASQGVHADFVALAVSGTGATPGTSVPYSVRAVTATGTGAASSVATGRRAAPATWTISWERSSGTAAENFSAIPGATGPTFNDTGAPADGSARFYRAVVRADGAITGYSPAVAGSRLPPPGVPGNVRATTDLEDAVEVRWSQVSGAIGYHVYRNGVKLTSGNGVTGTFYSDEGAPAVAGAWQAPTNLAASTDDSTQVAVFWQPPTRPVGADASYQVLAVNTAGDGPLSTAVTGRRAGPALTSYEVEVQWGTGSATWVGTQSSLAQYVHTNAPLGVIELGTTSVSDGDFRDFVRLSGGGEVANPVTVTYRVRGVLEDGSKTPVSASVQGYRAVGDVSIQWQRSLTTTTQGGFGNIAGATSAAFDDTAAPADGELRYFRKFLTAEGASPRLGSAAVGRRRAIVQISTSDEHTCAVDASGSVWCWGNQADGRLGNGQTELIYQRRYPVRVDGIDDAVEVSTGSRHTCARRQGGGVLCWGFNSSGQLGDGTNNLSAVPVAVNLSEGAVSISAGVSFSCAVLAGGQVRCWGINTAWQLGNGTQTSSLTPVAVRTGSSAVLTGGVQVSNSAASGVHSCALRGSNDIYCWGFPSSNYRGVLGHGLSTYGGYAVRVSGQTAYSEVQVGSVHACGRSTDGKVWCWGHNANGQLGTGDNENSLSPRQVAFSFPAAVKSISVVGAVTFALLSNGDVYSWGGSVGSTPAKDSRIDDVSFMTFRGGTWCGIVDDEPWCFGSNLYGQVSHGGEWEELNGLQFGSEEEFPLRVVWDE